MFYSVQRNDSTKLIAAKLGYPGQEALLVAANPGKPRMILHGAPNFQELYIDEVLQVPAAWAVRTLAAVPQGLGLPGSPPTLNWVQVGRLINGGPAYGGSYHATGSGPQPTGPVAKYAAQEYPGLYWGTNLNGQHIVWITDGTTVWAYSMPAGTSIAAPTAVATGSAQILPLNAPVPNLIATVTPMNDGLHFALTQVDGSGRVVAIWGGLVLPGIYPSQGPEQRPGMGPRAPGRPGGRVAGAEDLGAIGSVEGDGTLAGAEQGLGSLTEVNAAVGFLQAIVRSPLLCSGAVNGTVANFQSTVNASYAIGGGLYQRGPIPVSGAWDKTTFDAAQTFWLDVRGWKFAGAGPYSLPGPIPPACAPAGSSGGGSSGGGYRPGPGPKGKPGVYHIAGTPVGLGAPVDTLTALKALLTVDLSYPRLAVQAFEKAYNADVKLGTYGGPPLSQVGGEYGPKTAAAAQQVIDADPGAAAAFGNVAPGAYHTFGAETPADLQAILGKIIAAGTTCNAAATDDVLAFQDAWNHIQGTNVLWPDGVYGTNTAKVALTVNPAAPTCAVVPPPAAGPPLALVAAAQAVATDPSLCDPGANANVSAFMMQYAVWTGSTGLDTPSSYNADVQDAVNAVLFASGGVAAGNAPALCPVVPPTPPGGSGSAILLAALAVAAAAGGYYYLKNRHGSAPSPRTAVTAHGRVRSTLGRRGHVLAMHRAR